MSAHLDWHFRQRRREFKRSSRQWYNSTLSALEPETEAVPVFSESKPTADSEPSAMVVVEGDVEVNCSVCGEVFTKTWNSTEEEWMIAAKLVDGAYCHSTCLPTMKRAEDGERVAAKRQKIT
jgi:hypothetical protein